MPEHPIVQELRRLRPALSVGILTADLATLGAEVHLLEGAGARLVHFDVMDGCFCPMMTFGPPLVQAVKTRLIKDVHLMISEPLDKIGDYVAAGAGIITVHYESCRHIHRALQSMAGLGQPPEGIVRGLALNPGTPVEAIEPLLGELELVLLLAVNPGWKGQKYLPSTASRIAQARQMIAGAKSGAIVGVDGGVTRDNVAEIAATGVDLIVAGSAIFDSKAPRQNAEYMLQTLKGVPV